MCWFNCYRFVRLVKRSIFSVKFHLNIQTHNTIYKNACLWTKVFSVFFPQGYFKCVHYYLMIILVRLLGRQQLSNGAGVTENNVIIIDIYDVTIIGVKLLEQKCASVLSRYRLHHQRNRLIVWVRTCFFVFQFDCKFDYLLAHC